MSNNTDFSDLERLKSSLLRVGKLPQKCVTKAAKKGGNVVMKAVKSKAPVDTGTLKSGLKMKAEKSRKKGKKVYQITFSSDMNEVFQKKNAEGAVTGYYPASMEYGYFARDGSYIPGYHFMRQAAEEKQAEMESVTINMLADELDKEWAKK